MKSLINRFLEGRTFKNGTPRAGKIPVKVNAKRYRCPSANVKGRRPGPFANLGSRGSSPGRRRRAFAMLFDHRMSRSFLFCGRSPSGCDKGMKPFEREGSDLISKTELTQMPGAPWPGLFVVYYLLCAQRRVGPEQ